MDKYLIKYLIETTDSDLSKKYLDFFKVELDWHTYISKTHMSEGYYRDKKIGFQEKLKRLYQYTNAIFGQPNSHSCADRKVLSTFKIPEEQMKPFEEVGIDLYRPIWHPIGQKNIVGDFKTLKWHQQIQKRIRHADFLSFLDQEFHQDLEDFQQHLINQYQKQNFKALFLYTDQYFYSKYNIDIFKKMNRPSFVFTHGLPGIYTKEVDNRADYLMVWSNNIKENYVNAGFDHSKIKVIGHPRYNNLEKHKTLRSNLSDVLVIPVSSITWHQHEYDKPVVNDPSMVILYLYKVQYVLGRLGIKKARYRPHPSINTNWIEPFIDQRFYTVDKEPLTKSLNKSSLVIGANSTVLLEALMHGVNYIAFDPKDENGVNMSGYKSVPPFNGSEEKLMLAQTEAELEKMITDKLKTEYTLIHDYIQDFDISVLNEILD